jgi:hypothetical protein
VWQSIVQSNFRYKNKRSHKEGSLTEVGEIGGKPLLSKYSSSRVSSCEKIASTVSPMTLSDVPFIPFDLPQSAKILLFSTDCNQTVSTCPRR